MTTSVSARKFQIRGIVQGVGFRPFIYRLARRWHLNGSVKNTSSGVSIHVEGRPCAIDAFCRQIAAEKPPLAHITDIEEYAGTAQGFTDFIIAPSRREAQLNTLIPPDIGTCDHCLGEILDPNDRRFRYPFTNCTDCGPRYTITGDVPYDRPNTSMKHFRMCAECLVEYNNPLDRRFHAQPNACPVCGPQVRLHDTTGRRVETNDPLNEAGRMIRSGRILAIKGLGGFHLAVNALDNGAVQRLRQKKGREEKPFALMAPDLQTIEQFAVLTPEERTLLASPARPIVLVRKRDPNPIAVSVSPGNRYFGVMLPYTPLHHVLMANGFFALVLTSGNRREEPISIDNEDAVSRLSGIADAFLLHDRDIYLRSDDAIVFHAAGAARMLRRSRGFIPTPVFLNAEMPEILACGGELKNTLCLTKSNRAFLSQHIGDMENLRTLDFFQQTAKHMKRILDIAPQAVAFDLHPDYMSTQYAHSQTGLMQIPVQHHHAHIVSCMAENHVDGDVIGLAFDGTGFGTDGHVWGGEVLIANHGAFERAAHLAYIPMPGGQAAIKEPWRMAVAYLHDAFGENQPAPDLPVLRDLPGDTRAVIARMISRKINSPLTSSLGRLFDGIAAITGIRRQVHYEGQAAMALEMLVPDDGPPLHGGKTFPYELPPCGRGPIPVRPIIAGVVSAMARGASPPEISARFHWTVIRLFADICMQLRRETGLDRVALSGGVFQNRVLLKGLAGMLEAEGFLVYSHQLVPSNDGGLSLGQAVAAAAMYKKHN